MTAKVNNTSYDGSCQGLVYMKYRALEVEMLEENGKAL